MANCTEAEQHQFQTYREFSYDVLRCNHQSKTARNIEAIQHPLKTDKMANKIWNQVIVALNKSYCNSRKLRLLWHIFKGYNRIMERDKAARLLAQGKELIYQWPDKPLPQEATFKRALSLVQVAVEPPDLYPPRALQEMPEYVFRQKMARTKPFQLMLFEHTKGLENDIQFGFHVEFYLSDLDEIDQFLSQFDITICDFKEELTP